MHSAFVISDLHLGGNYPSPEDVGKRGFRLCTHADAIVRFVEDRARDAERKSTEIVLNGDTVDFLAETNSPEDGGSTWSSFTGDSLAAIRKFRSIVARDKPVFDSFGPFLDAGGKLTVLLGNHDIELSLPDVRQEFRRALGIRPITILSSFTTMKLTCSVMRLLNTEIATILGIKSITMRCATSVHTNHVACLYHLSTPLSHLPAAIWSRRSSIELRGSTHSSICLSRRPPPFYQSCWRLSRGIDRV